MQQRQKYIETYLQSKPNKDTIMNNQLQYISQGNTVEEQVYNIHKALDNGCDWIQMRFKKNYSDDAFTLAEAVKC
jgi:thiamine-phosphate pyrophosphorylase